MEVKLDKWFRPKIDKEVLRKLSKKSDLKGMLHVGIYFCFLIITGLFAYYTWGTWWSVFWFYVYGNIYCFCNPIWHETGHKTAFKTKAFNEFFSGYNESPDDYLSKTFEDVQGYEDIVMLKDISFHSHCEHHMVPIIGKVHLAYIPTKKVVGISKLARVVDILSLIHI